MVASKRLIDVWCHVMPATEMIAELAAHLPYHTARRNRIVTAFRRLQRGLDANLSEACALDDEYNDPGHYAVEGTAWHQRRSHRLNADIVLDNLATLLVRLYAENVPVGEQNTVSETVKLAARAAYIAGVPQDVIDDIYLRWWMLDTFPDLDPNSDLFLALVETYRLTQSLDDCREILSTRGAS